MKKLKCLVAITLLIQPHWGMANPGDGWVFIGVDSMDAGAKVYVKEDRVSDLGNRNILVPSFTVHDVTLRGIEMQGPDGTWYNTQYPHRSLLTWGVYDLTLGIACGLFADLKHTELTVLLICDEPILPGAGPIQPHKLDAVGKIAAQVVIEHYQ